MSLPSHNLTPLRAVALAPAFVLGGFAAAEDGAVPAMPSGWLTANPSVVQTGVHPYISWGINFPSVVEDYIDIVDEDTVKATEEIECEVRVLGAGVTAGSGSRFEFVPTEGRISYNGGSYDRIFYGTNWDVRPDEVVWSKTMRKGSTLRFGGRYYYSRSWGPWFSSGSSNHNVRTLIDGQVPPTTTPMHTAPTLESFIKPYLDGTGAVRIGPMDVIVFMELTHYDSQITDQGYDLQDLVLLVTFKAEPSTNENAPATIDDVDSTDPNGNPFIMLDPDPDWGFEDDGE